MVQVFIYVCALRSYLKRGHRRKHTEKKIAREETRQSDAIKEER